MIIPNKSYILRYSILGASLKLISNLENSQTISSLWEKVRNYEEVNTFEKYILSLDFLYMIGLINFDMGLITLNTSSNGLLENSLGFTCYKPEFPKLKGLTSFLKLCEVLNNDFAE